MDEKSRSDPFGPDSSPLEDVLRRLEDHLLSGDGYEILKGEDDGAKPSETEGLLAGTVVDDFELVSLLGEGGMGQVWEARQLSIGRSVALKLLHPHIQFTEKGVARFQREATAGGRLTHKGIVQVYAIGVADGRNYMAQELVSGGRTLSDFLAEFRGKRELPSDYHQKIAALFAAIADALTHAHENGVIHRDIKPSNILIGEDGEPKIADFGLALVEDQLGLSRTGDHVGTPFYMSPEQAASERETIDHRTDIFSLGATLYEFLTLTRPFNGDTGQQVMHQILLVDPPDPRKLRSRVPRDLSIICLKALEKAATHRYSTMQELSADLKRHLLDQTIHAKPPGPGQRTRKWARRNPTKSVAAVVALVALVAISAMWSRAEDAREQTGQALSLADELLLQTSSGNSLPRSEAMPILAEAARFSREEGGDAPLPAAARLRSVGRMYERLGEYEEAVECLRDALAFTAEGGGSGDDLRQLKLELVNAHELAWDLKKARPLLYELLEESPRPIRDLIGAEALGRLLLVERRLDEKEGKEALEAEHGDIKALLTEVSESLGPEQVRARLHLDLLALRVSSHGVEPEDLEVLQDQIEREFGPDHEMALWSLTVRRFFFVGVDRREEAKELAEELLLRAERSRPAGNYFSGLANWGIGECIFHLGLTEDAAKHALVYYNKALEVFEDKLGSENYRVMVLRSGRAVIAMNAGQADIAESDFRLILSIREEQMGKNHMHTCFTLRALAESIERQGRYEESWELLDEAASRARVADRLFDPENLTRVSYQLGMLLHGRRLERAAATALEFDGLEEFAGDEERRTALYTYMVRGLERYFSGANEEAAELLGRAVALAGEEERVMERALYAYFNEGDTDLMDLLFEEGEEGGDAFTSMVFHCVLGEACVRSGNLEGARGHLERVRLGALGSWSREGKLIEAWPSALEERIKSAETK